MYKLVIIFKFSVKEENSFHILQMIDSILVYSTLIFFYNVLIDTLLLKLIRIAKLILLGPRSSVIFKSEIQVTFVNWFAFSHWISSLPIYHVQVFYV